MELPIDAKHTIVESPQRSAYNMHTHNFYEIYCFLSGDAEYFVEGNRYPLQRGDLMLMRKGEAHHLILKSDATYERICVHFDAAPLAALDPAGKLLKPFLDHPLGEHNQFRAVQYGDRPWMYYLEKMCSYSDPARRLYYLLTLLNELSEYFEEIPSHAQPLKTDLAAAVINYINSHLSQELSLPQLAQMYGISKNRLNVLFRQAAGTTVWQYITVKRLLAAREKIISGEMPTEVYLECGFQDYSTFYRSYTRHFGVSPKADAVSEKQKFPRQHSGGVFWY